MDRASLARDERATLDRLPNAAQGPGLSPDAAGAKPGAPPVATMKHARSMSIGPEPRYRLYTTPSHYLSLAKDLVRGWPTDETDCRRLEDEIARRCAVEHAICVPQDRVGVYFVVKALVRPGRKIVLSPYTLSDVINMVICAGAVPVFADIDRKTCNVDPNEVEQLVDSETDAVLVTHLHGLVCDMPRITEICRRRGVRLIEDAAQAFGSRLGGVETGAFGDAGVFSFGMYKNVTGFYGGMVVTGDPTAAEAVCESMRGLPLQQVGRLLRKAASALATDIATYPPVFKALTYRVFRKAYLSGWQFFNRRITIEDDVRRKTAVPPHYLVRMSPAQARVVLRSLPQVDRDARARIEAAQLYDAGLSDIPDLLLPPLRMDGSHTYTYYPLQCPERLQLIEHMLKQGRDVAVQHLRNCAELDAFRDVARQCPRASATAKQTILLSTYPRFTLKEVERNVAAIRSFYGRA
jgi:perosamine synthetase